MSEKRPMGFWVIFAVSILWLIMMFLGQVMAFINYDFAVSLGLQESEFQVTAVGVAMNKGFGVADTVVYIPLIIVGLVGLWRKKTWGLIAMAGNFAVTAYFPVVCLFMLFFSRGIAGFNFNSFLSYTVYLSLIFIYGAWGLWYVYSRRDRLLA